jgi:hypothetical protein
VIAASSSATIFDTLKITATPVPVTVATNPVARSVSVQQGNAAPSDNATVTLSGTNASSTSWTATKKKAWLTLTTTSGTGNGTVTWTRNAAGLVVGTYVDTITVAAASSSATVYDTLKVTSAGATVMTVSPAAKSISIPQGQNGWSDDEQVTFVGPNAATTAWSATHSNVAWAGFVNTGGVGNGAITWGRYAAALPVGTYVDTITVTAVGVVGPPIVVFDTVKVTGVAAPPPPPPPPAGQVTLSVTPGARRVSIVQGSAAPGDSVQVTLSGTNADATNWWVVKRQAWLTVVSATGTGSTSIRWTRNASGLVPGTYVDTLTVSTAVTSSITVFDTLVVTATVVPVTVAVNPGARFVAVAQGSNAPSDNAVIVLSGTNASSTGWTATKRQSWLSFTTSAGTGSGQVAWVRNTSGLAVGTYVDTITVSAGSASAVLYDTLRITSVAAPLVMTVSPASKSVVIQQGGAGFSDDEQVSFAGTSANAAAWFATHTSAPWAAFVNVSGIGNGAVTWGRNISALTPGLYVDTITVTSTATGQSVRVYDSVRVLVVAAPPPTPSTIDLAPHGRRVRSYRFAGASSLSALDGDSVRIDINAPDSISAGGWSASVSSSRLVLFASSGLVNSFLKWSRATQSYEPGVYVDSVVVSLQRDPSVRAIFVDSLEVVAVAVPVPDAAVGDLFDHVSLTDDQRIALDRQGNGNGRYDLGDFLAWVNRNHIHLTPAASLRMKQAATIGLH